MSARTKKRKIIVHFRRVIGNYHLCCWSSLTAWSNGDDCGGPSFMRTTIHDRGRLVFKVGGTYGQFDTLDTPSRVQMFMWRIGLMGRPLIS